MPRDLSRRQMLLAGAGGLLAKTSGARGPSATSAAPPASPLPVPQQGSVARIESLVPELLAQSKTPGLSIAILRDRQIVYTKGFGLSNVAIGRPVTPETIFQAASLTKPVSAYAALKLCQSGLLGLDTPLVEYMAHARISRDTRARRITPRMIMAHMSGLPNVAGARPMRIEFDPGARFGYSGEAFTVLQEALEQQAGAPLNDLLMDTVATPFEMTHSAFIWNNTFESTAALGYEWDGTPVRSRSRPAEANAASSLHTTARDYATFMIASLALQRRAPAQLDYASERMMLSPQVRLAGPLAWGLGWALLLRDAGDIHWHFGDSRGFMNYAAMSRATGDGVVIFTNGRNGLRVCHAVTKGLLDRQDEIFSWIYDVFYEGKLPQWPAPE